MMTNKYNIDFPESSIKHNIDRLTNQIWKLIPMRENNENWKDQLEKVLIELIGLNEILILNDNYLIILANLEGLKNTEVEFINYRSKVFESINLLRGCFNAKNT